MKTETVNNTQEARSSAAPGSGADSTKRVKKAWWAVVEGGRVVHVEGHSCAPMNPDHWWCPAVGLSLCEKYHLFEREEDAVRKAVAEAEREVVTWTKTVKRLKARLPNEKLTHGGESEKKL